MGNSNNIDMKKFKETYTKLNNFIEELCKTPMGYRYFELAFLSIERLGNINLDEFTQEDIEEINKICDNTESLINNYVNEELDILERKIEEELENEEL